MSRKALYVVGTIVVVIIVIVIALPFLIDANKFRPKVEAEATKALGRQVKVGNLKLSILSGGVKADDLAVAEDPAFGKDPFLTAKSMDIGVDIWPLITSSTLNIRSFTITNPRVILVHAANGKWNVSTLGGKNSNTKSQSSNNFNVGKFKLVDGALVVIHQGTSAKPNVYSNVNLTATDVALNKSFPFTFSAVPPGGGSMKAEGNFGPMSSDTATGTPLDAKLKISKFDLAQSGFMDPASGIRGLVDLDADLKSDGKIAKLDAKGTGTRLALVPAGSDAKVPVGLDLGADYNLERQAGTITKGIVKIGNSPANIGGNFDMSGATTRLNMKVDANSLAVGDVQGILPALGVILPAGAALQGGNASAHANIAGPTNALVTTGNVNVENTKLTGFDFASKLAAISKLTGVGGGSGNDTLIQLFAGDLKMAPAGTDISNLKLVVPNLGTVTGGGTIGTHNELNFKMLAQLQTTAGSPMGALTQVMGGGQSKGIPFRITGTTNNPVFVPDVAGAVGSMVSGQAQQQGVGGVLGNLGGLFGKKKKQ